MQSAMVHCICANFHFCNANCNFSVQHSSICNCSVQKHCHYLCIYINCAPMHSEIARSQMRTLCNCNCNAMLSLGRGHGTHTNPFFPIPIPTHASALLILMKIRPGEDAVPQSIPQLRTRTEYTYLPVIPHAHAHASA